MAKSDNHREAPTNGHACFIYGSSNERLDLIAEYFQQGIAKNELCIFVTPELPEKAIESFQKAGFDAQAAVKNRSLRLFQMDQTYLPEGYFAADYMLENVSSFIEDANTQGYSGLRTAGEMSWLTEHPEFVTEAKTYEHNINSLKKKSRNFTGLCLYPAHDGFSEVLQTAAHTHPLYVSGGQFQLNPHYSPTSV